MTQGRRIFLKQTSALAAGIAAGPLAGLATGTNVAHAAQQAWPTRPIRLVVPYTAGGSSDIIARLISKQLGEALGQSVVVDNKPGANGNVGAAMVAQATDNHTLMLCDIGALAISPSVYTKLSFNIAKDLKPVTMLAYSPHLLVVHPSVQVSSVKELVELSRRSQLNFAVTAIGSAPHLAGVAVEQATGAKWQYVPYKGGSQAIADTVGGSAQVLMNGMLATLPHVQSGKLKLIAQSKRTRMPLLQNVPTIAEQGVPNFESGTWQGVMAPASMPDALVTRLNAELIKIIRAPELRSQLVAQGAEVVTMTPAETGKFFVAEQARWAGVVKQAGIKLEA
ncbi:Bug family tripartite tricarboxylate transporter substrate binding protein [Cupriavidus oxalaticus]|uniref:ABC transporter substrate-binding protein n=1 Tax=Cupriavidus oxalaticus TaxID=96344 RepID=A0A976BHL4_9BURK|nr:tripartite tricarboxylate transporter substrate binding protein [Cupriavidus oxalaticus]QRQ84438.1 tripartite tricarboxylate transporter substrate binding protein [Cupriavidus oxalaticus]QRQ91475.1 tripartite tricarboxylate transporter substrate binding protein [Cupriavidus oxalaticus]WQD86043.1 tripartite tricarboxylate transporter substrate binding protein [Cupriavidus oxalaticus]SPC19668.1 ABC transporter substrate-binding protein [Cupriavidus oxalaticus]